MRFQDAVVVVTGAAAGIGQATLVAFAREGARVVLVDKAPERGQPVVDQLQRDGHEVLVVRSDVADERDVRAMIEQVTGRWNRLDVLVNNVGIYLQGDVTQTSLEEWERVMRVNVTSAFLCTKYAVPTMIAQKRGVIVNVASEAGLVGIKGQVVYNVSKGALIAFTRSCAVDLAVHGIRARRQLEQSRPANRLGTPEEIAAAITYLASDDAAYATGAILSVDGGYTAQ